MKYITNSKTNLYYYYKTLNVTIKNRRNVSIFVFSIFSIAFAIVMSDCKIRLVTFQTGRAIEMLHVHTEWQSAD